MAFALRNLSVLAYANGFTLWHYKSSDEQRLASRPSYFEGAGDMLSPGDIIMVSASDGGRILSVAQGETALCTAPLG